jgi:type I restriction enzyme S subunit
MNLPHSWLEERLGHIVVDIQSGFAQRPGDEDLGTVPQIRTHNVTPDGHITKEGIKHVTPSQAELARFSLRKLDVIFNNTNSEEWVGKTALFDLDGQYVFSNRMTRIRVDDTVADPAYVARYLHFLWSIGYSRQRAKRWVSQAALDQATLLNFKIALPPVVEQRRIVSQLGEFDAVIAAKKTLPSGLRDVCRECFIERFGLPSSNPLNFPTKPLSSLGTLDRGVSKHRPRDADHLYGGPYPFIQTGDVANAGDWITTYSSTYSSAGLAQSRLWPRGTLCITIAANIANAAILEFDACFPDSIVGFTPNEGVTTEYVLYCIRSYQSYFESLAPQAAQKNINLETLRPLKLPLPPLELQDKFQRFLHAVRLISMDLKEQLPRVDELRREFALAGFGGDLTETWRGKNSESIRQEADTRRRDREVSARARVEFAELVPAEREIQLYRPERAWLVEQLSDFQQRVRLTLLTEWRGTLIAGDLEALDAFCRLWPVEHDKDRRDQIRRALQQLAALGLIAKVSVRQTQDDGEVLFVDGFRPLRDEEVNPSRDYEALKPLLRTAGNEA